MLDLNNKSILITGGTGSFGKAFTQIILSRYPKVKRLAILSRDEQKHFQMGMAYPESKYPALRYFVGDVRDRKRLFRAFEGVDIVIHAAAMKHVHIAEYNPMECVNTNILGAENVIDAALACGVKDVVALSTDKAAAPINLYGATKLASDKLFVAANNIRGSRDIKFSVVRYGNVMGSNGSVVPFFLKKRKQGILPITDHSMTRFNILLNQAVDMVLYVLINSWGGEIYVPKIPSYRIIDLANAIDKDCKQKIVGVRAGEKIHEEMISSSDSYTTYDLGGYYVILPYNPIWSIEEFKNKFNARKVVEGFSYNSKDNNDFLSVKQINKLINNLNLQI